MYTITDYTKQKAKQLNVDVIPSKNKTKKIDVYKNGVKVCSIGDISYSDYPTYIKTHGLVYANERRKLYKIRHKKDIDKSNSAGFYSWNLLW